MNPASATTLATDCAKALGLTLDAAGLEAVSARCAAMLDHGPAGIAFTASDASTVDVRDGKAVDIEPGAWLVREIRTHATAADREAAPSSEPAPRTAYDKVKAEARAARQAEKVQAAREAMATGNPWASGKINRTHQAIIGMYLPEEAAKLRRAAGQ